MFFLAGIARALLASSKLEFGIIRVTRVVRVTGVIMRIRIILVDRLITAITVIKDHCAY